MNEKQNVYLSIREDTWVEPLRVGGGELNTTKDETGTKDKMDEKSPLAFF